MQVQRLKGYYYQARRLPVGVIAHKALRRAQRVTMDLSRHVRAATRGTYLRRSSTPAIKHSYFRIDDADLDLLDRDTLFALTRRWCKHEFNILGSGWLRADRPAGAPRPTINTSNAQEAERIAALLPAHYRPIDWQADFKSGHRWSEDRWHTSIRFGNVLGVDIKVPWELSRLHHLPQMALTFALARRRPDGCHLDALDVGQEVRNQLLDFVRSNPPGYGVNWCSSINSGIRAANILVALDILTVFGVPPDPEVDNVIVAYVFSHAQQILDNLEWSPELQASHYLGNIVGLLFIAAYFDSTPFLDSLLAFAVQEFIGAVEKQFHDDGSNFEGSTCYHASSAEMVAYGAAIILALPERKLQALQDYDSTLIKRGPGLAPAPLQLFPLSLIGTEENHTLLTPLTAPLWDKIRRMRAFLLDVTKPNGRVVQIGDNDSSRFLRLDPRIISARPSEDDPAPAGSKDLEEDDLDHSHLVATIDGFFPRPSGGTPPRFESQAIRRIIRARAVDIRETPRGCPEQHRPFASWEQEILGAHGHNLKTTLIHTHDRALLQSLNCVAYEDFGYFVFRSERFFLGLRCGSLGQHGAGGHAHNDQLSIELNVDGEDIIADPGTYCYTPFPEIRNRYRSITAHFAPRRKNLEPISLDQGLFLLSGDILPKCLYFGPEGFIGSYTYVDSEVYRIVSFREHIVVVRDLLEGNDLDGPGFLEFRSLNDLKRHLPVVFSPGYGKLLASRPLEGTRGRGAHQ